MGAEAEGGAEEEEEEEEEDEGEDEEEGEEEEEERSASLSAAKRTPGGPIGREGVHRVARAKEGAGGGCCRGERRRHWCPGFFGAYPTKH